MLRDESKKLTKFLQQFVFFSSFFVSRLTKFARLSTRMRINRSEPIAQIKRSPDETIPLRVFTQVTNITRFGAIVRNGHLKLVQEIDIIAEVAFRIVGTSGRIAIFTNYWTQRRIRGCSISQGYQSGQRCGKQHIFAVRTGHSRRTPTLIVVRGFVHVYVA